jgi:hypothetical protein
VEVLRELPPFPLDKLKRMLEQMPALAQAELKAKAGFRSGSRR